MCDLMRLFSLARPASSAPLCLFTLALACSGDDAVVSASATAATDTATATATDTDAGTTGESTGEAPALDPLPAKGITLTDIVADQGVAVPIGRDGLMLGGADRNAYIIANRRTLIRAYFTVEEGFVPRPLRAKITLRYADGREESGDKVLTISGDSAANHLDSTFWWHLPPEMIEPGMSLEIRVWETVAPAPDELPPPAPPVFPTSGVALLGVETSYQVMRVLLVPIKHQLDGKTCPDAPVLDEVALTRFHDYLFMQNPVEQVDLAVREPITWTDGLGSFSPLLSHLSKLRAEDGATPEVYYYGVVRPCDGGPDGVGGQAFGIPNQPTKSNGYQRVSVGRFYGSLASTVDTFVHEVGHSQGRYHIDCGGAAGTDPNYPYPGGKTGVWGFGVLHATLHSPNKVDYMTYCGPTWVSDWAWNKVYAVIKELSSWDNEGPRAVEPARELLIGALYPDDTEEWWTAPGGVDPADHSALHHLEIQRTDGQRLILPALFQQRPDDTTYNFVVELPTGLGLAQIAAIERVSGDERAQIPVHTIAQIRPRLTQ